MHVFPCISSPERLSLPAASLSGHHFHLSPISLFCFLSRFVFFLEHDFCSCFNLVMRHVPLCSKSVHLLVLLHACSRSWRSQGVQMASGPGQMAWGDPCLLAMTCKSRASARSCSVQKCLFPLLTALLMTSCVAWCSPCVPGQKWLLFSAGGWILSRMLCT